MEILITLVAWPIISSVMQYAKKKWLSSKLVIAVMILVAWAWYAIFDNLAPLELKNSIVMLATSTATWWVMFYELILKPYNAQE